MRSKKTVLYIFFVLYLSAFVFAVFMQNDRKNINHENINSLVNFIPLKNTLNDISYLMEYGLRGNMNLFINTFGNIVLFVPLPIFLIGIFHCNKLLNIVLIALMLSLLVEAMQYLCVLGVSDIDDVLLNVLGAFIGCVFIISQ